LATLLGCLDALDQYFEDGLVVKVLFGLINDEWNSAS
jgi:hypothetical protein